jgi:hypothetical protein
MAQMVSIEQQPVEPAHMLRPTSPFRWLLADPA